MLNETQSLSTINDFEVIKQIGKGSYGTVFKVKRKKDGQIYAMKCILISAMDRKTIESTLNEVRILCSISHPNIVEYKDVFLHKNDTELCLIMEFVGGGDLAETIAQFAKRKQKIAEPIIWKYFYQILLGLKALNDMKIIHRDIKAANLFLSDNLETIKLGDLNVAKIAKNDLAKTQIGTPYYLAPEIWKNETYSYKCDVYSTGVLLYEMACLKFPFEGNSMQALFKKVSAGIISKIPDEYSADLYNMIKFCLTPNPKNRPSVSELLNSSTIKKRVANFRMDFENESEKLGKLIDTIKMDKKMNKVIIDLPKKKRFRPSSVGVLQKPKDDKSEASEKPKDEKSKDQKLSDDKNQIDKNKNNKQTEKDKVNNEKNKNQSVDKKRNNSAKKDDYKLAKVENEVVLPKIQKDAQNQIENSEKKEEATKRNVSELMEIIKTEKQRNQSRGNNREGSMDGSKKEVDLKAEKTVKLNKQPPLKLPPMKPSGKPNVMASNKNQDSKNDDTSKYMSEQPRKDSKSRQQSPKVQAYNEYLEKLIEQNRIYMEKKRESSREIQRCGSADPRKKALDNYQEPSQKPFGW